LAGLEEPVELATVGERERVQRTLLASCEAHGLDAAARDEQADRLAAALELAPDFREKRLFGLMTPEEMAAASREGVDIQLHTHRHRTPRDRELFLREIRENRERLEEWTGRRLTHFCYPSGVVHPEFLPWLSESGVKTATTCVPGLSLASTERLLLPRLVDTSGLSDIEFEGWLAGASQWLPRRPVSFG
jgi:hypothetical protein